jgi:hypothetical protein
MDFVHTVTELQNSGTLTMKHLHTKNNRPKKGDINDNCKHPIWQAKDTLFPPIMCTSNALHS